MATLKPEFGTPGQAITITLAGLASGAARQSTAWDWSQWLDILISLQIKAGTSPSATGVIDVYVFATTDDGALYTGSAGATDAAITLLVPTELLFLARSFPNATGQVRREGAWSIASVFGGTLPAKGGIVVRNSTGVALDATESNHIKTWQGVRTQN